MWSALLKDYTFVYIDHIDGAKDTQNTSVEQYTENRIEKQTCTYTVNWLSVKNCQSNSVGKESF